MKRFAVAHYSLFTNELILTIVTAEDWRDALAKHPILLGDLDMKGYLTDSENVPDLETAKRLAFDADSAIDVMEIPNA